MAQETFAIFTATGGANELWSFGDDVYAILRGHCKLREKLRPYVEAQIAHYSRTGDPIMRPLFYEFPDDERSWNIDDNYMFGADLLVAPVLQSGAGRRSVSLPLGASWRDSNSGALYQGGQTIELEAPLEFCPVRIRDDRPNPMA